MSISSQLLCIPVVIGSIGSVVELATAWWWLRTREPSSAPASANASPPVTVLKPLFGIDKHMRDNLRAICTQDYPRYQVVLSAQRRDDPAIPIMRAIAAEFGPERVTLSIADAAPTRNGKAENLAHAYAHARHDVIVISDSDVAVPTDYLRRIVAPLADPRVGYVCTLVRAAGADNVWERLELVSFNVDFVPILVLGMLSRIATFCIGATTAVRRRTLDSIGGFASLAEYMVEDAEMGRRIQAAGYEGRFLPTFVTTFVELPSAAAWWNYQVYWDQNARYVSFVGFIALLLLKAVPFALLFAATRGFDRTGVAVLLGALGVRLSTAAGFLLGCVRDRETLRSLWLLPLRDVASLGAWFAAALRKQFTRRGVRFAVSRTGLVHRA